MKEPMKVGWWTYWIEFISHWSWCELHYGSTWYRRALRSLRYNTHGNILAVGLFMLFIAWILSYLLAGLLWFIT